MSLLLATEKAAPISEYTTSCTGLHPISKQPVGCVDSSSTALIPKHPGHEPHHEGQGGDSLGVGSWDKGLAAYIQPPTSGSLGQITANSPQ